MKKLFLFFALSCSTLYADIHFDYYELLLLESHLGIVQSKVDKYQNVMDYEDYGTIKHYIKACQLVVHEKTEETMHQVK